MAPVQSGKDCKRRDLEGKDWNNVAGYGSLLSTCIETPAMPNTRKQSTFTNSFAIGRDKRPYMKN